MNKLVGNYKLLSHGTYNRSGEFTPTSQYLKGELIYSSEGYLSVLIFFNEDSEIPRKFLAYSGNYEITGDSEVIHKINICSNSKKNRTQESRNYRFIDNFLFLSCTLDGGEIFEAKWERFN
ncbi:MAG: lipocalin-like domain-containing protein [Bacteriovorax sp.]|nr:lipocalin-like domain-containing protein [Bacteriovorax sp.]